jgi:hypothetical protein
VTGYAVPVIQLWDYASVQFVNYKRFGRRPVGNDAQLSLPPGVWMTYGVRALQATGRQTPAAVVRPPPRRPLPPAQPPGRRADAATAAPVRACRFVGGA